jgi:hypothetical protein
MVGSLHTAIIQGEPIAEPSVDLPEILNAKVRLPLEIQLYVGCENYVNGPDTAQSYAGPGDREKVGWRDWT